MIQRYAKLLEVLVGQARKDLAVNVVRGEHCRILDQAKTLEPLANIVHNRHPRVADRS